MHRTDSTTWDWFDVWMGILAALTVVVAVSLLVLLFARKDVDYYYLSKPNSGVACVYAHWTWHQDEQAFCSNNYQEVLEFNDRANASIATRGKTK